MKKLLVFLFAALFISLLAGTGVVVAYANADARLSIIDKSAAASLAVQPGIRGQQVAMFEQISKYEDKLARTCADGDAACRSLEPASAYLAYLESVAKSLRNDERAAYAIFDRAVSLRPQAQQDARVLANAKLWSEVTLYLIPCLALLAYLFSRWLNDNDGWSKRSRRYR